MSDSTTQSGNTFKVNFNWQATLYPQVERVLRENATYMLRLRLATPQEDMKNSTDMVLEVDGGKIAVRLRRWESHKGKYRDFTIRSYKDGNMTELEKLRSGRSDVRWYLYGWMDTNEYLAEWALVDVQTIVKSGLLSKPRPEIPNGDGTKFVAISLTELKLCNAIIRSRVKHESYWVEHELCGAGDYTVTRTLANSA